MVPNTEQHLRFLDLHLGQRGEESLLELGEGLQLLGHKPFPTHWTLEPTLFGVDSALLDLGGDRGAKVPRLDLGSNCTCKEFLVSPG